MDLPVFSFSEEIKKLELPVALGVGLFEVDVTDSSEAEIIDIARRIGAIQNKLTLERIHDLPAIAATRKAYKALGKDPSRYRPSAEALLRRVVQGKGLYRVNNVVDALNLVSITSGYSIGGYDAEKINGAVTLGRGQADEPYEAIGRGALNIEGLPVLRDDTGTFGSPTSDSQRTMVTEATEYFLAVFFDFSGHPPLLQAAMDDLQSLLENHANAYCEAREIVK
ncbi:MAG: hypothetical protein CMN32_03845 [Saprospirales bacterium]|nr:hypothetical protein [Saprospirales bacterium]